MEMTMNNPHALRDLGCSVEPCGASESVLHYPCVVIAIVALIEFEY
jgi:hypothetical protein